MATETIERDGIVYERAGIVLGNVIYLRADYGRADINAVAQRVAETIRKRNDGLGLVGSAGPELVNQGDRT